MARGMVTRRFAMDTTELDSVPHSLGKDINRVENSSGSVSDLCSLILVTLTKLVLWRLNCLVPLDGMLFSIPINTGLTIIVDGSILDGTKYAKI